MTPASQHSPPFLPNANIVLFGEVGLLPAFVHLCWETDATYGSEMDETMAQEPHASTIQLILRYPSQ